MTTNFFVFVLLFSLICYATLGGRHENGQSVEETVIIEQILEESELTEEETGNDVETEFVEETEYVVAYPTEEIEEVVEDCPIPLDCGCRKARKQTRSPVAKLCPRLRTTPCSCSMSENMEGHKIIQAQLPDRIPSKPKIIKKIIRRVIPSAKNVLRPTETVSCSPAVEPNVEEVVSEDLEAESPVEETKEETKETKQSSKLDKQIEVEASKEKASKKNGKSSKQSEKTNQKVKNQKGKKQKPGNKPQKKSKQ